MNDERTIVGLDIGTNVIKVAIGKYNENNKIEIVATSSKKSSGLKNGVIVNIEQAKDAIKAAIEDVEQTAGMLVENVVVAIGGQLIQSENASGIIPIKPNPKTNRSEVTQQDIDRAIETAIAINHPADRSIIHVIPQNYLVDGVSIGTQSPINRIGFKLEVQVHVITASKTVIQNTRSCMSRADYFLDSVMLKTLAQTQSVCHDDELELGSVLIDLGAETTDFMVLLHGAPISTGSVPVGQNLVTSDISIVTGIPTAAAEKIKLEHGCCWLSGIGDDEDVILPGVGGRPPELIAKSQLCQIIQARVEQIFTLLKVEIRKNTSDTIPQLSGNIILTGGGALMDGIVELVQAKFKTSAVRIGIPENLGGNEREYRRADFATVIGLLQSENLIPKDKVAKKSSSNKKNSNNEGFFKRLKHTFF